MSARSQGKRAYANRFTHSLYIALEGPDGVGKSTVAAALKERLLSRENTPYSTVRIRHFPTDALTQCAKEDGRALTVEDYMLDMENWLAFRPEPVEYPDTPTHAAQPDTLYILDRWALSTAVYASLRGEPIPFRARPTLGWLGRIPLTTFVLMPKTPEALTDPDYPDPDGYDPEAVTEAYRGILANAFVSGCFSQFVPIVVDRGEDEPRSIAQTIAEWMEAL